MILNDHAGTSFSRVGKGQYKVIRAKRVLGYVRRSNRWRNHWDYRVPGNSTWIAVPGTRVDAADHLLSALSPSAAWLVAS